MPIGAAPGTMNRYCTPTVCLVLSLLSNGPLAGADRRPNLIVIMADDLGYGDLSCYDRRGIDTPHLDEMARQGMRFLDFHSNGPVCSPTRAALLTGRYQQRSGIDQVVFADPARGLRDSHGLRPSETTFATLLRASGYRTALFGKWHLGYSPRFNPVRHGFDDFRGFVSGNVDYHSHIDQAGFLDWWRGEAIEDEPGYTTHLINGHALRFVERNRDRPFCLYIAHEAPHSPYQGPGDPPVRGEDAQPARSGPAEIRQAYGEMVRALDDGVGDLLAMLSRLGLDRETFVFFCSDNGANRNGNNGRLRGFKGSLWEGGHRVPAIARWPGRIGAGVSGATAMSADLFPTLLDLAGVPSPEGHAIDGESLCPLLIEGLPLPSRTLFWAYNDQFAVRKGPWKLIGDRTADAPRAGRGAGPSGRLALFHLGEDPQEQADHSSRHPRKVEELLDALAAWELEVDAPSPKSR